MRAEQRHRIPGDSIRRWQRTDGHVDAAGSVVPAMSAGRHAIRWRRSGTAATGGARRRAMRSRSPADHRRGGRRRRRCRPAPTELARHRAATAGTTRRRRSIGVAALGSVPHRPDPRVRHARRSGVRRRTDDPPRRPAAINWSLEVRHRLGARSSACGRHGVTSTPAGGVGGAVDAGARRGSADPFATSADTTLGHPWS